MYAFFHNGDLTCRKWDNKDGCRGSTVDDCLAYLLSLEAGTWTTHVGCESLARKLIAFHDDLIWRDVTYAGGGRDAIYNQPRLPKQWPGGHCFSLASGTNAGASLCYHKFTMAIFTLRCRVRYTASTASNRRLSPLPWSCFLPGGTRPIE